ncbi:hypothetical protein [Geminocystis herdmanii]|uniref:hypothetical protein n=1 Tax=Geminocystis herdmanii TaxID=669359 RepID=UPI000344D1F5|nr:hypothetical protein [Geminocystis herdmanii]
MEATKVKGIVNEKGELIIEDEINLTAGEVKIVILKNDNLKNIKKENKLSINQEEKKINKPIWEIAENLIEDMSEAEKAEMPKDGALEHDHYIYGTPKINK